MVLRYSEDTLTGPYIMNLREARSEDFKAPLLLICLWLLQRRWLKGILIYCLRQIFSLSENSYFSFHPDKTENSSNVRFFFTCFLSFILLVPLCCGWKSQNLSENFVELVSKMSNFLRDTKDTTITLFLWHIENTFFSSYII